MLPRFAFVLLCVKWLARLLILFTMRTGALDTLNLVLRRVVLLAFLVGTVLTHSLIPMLGKRSVATVFVWSTDVGTVPVSTRWSLFRRLVTSYNDLRDITLALRGSCVCRPIIRNVWTSRTCRLGSADVVLLRNGPTVVAWSGVAPLVIVTGLGTALERVDTRARAKLLWPVRLGPYLLRVLLRAFGARNLRPV